MAALLFAAIAADGRAQCNGFASGTITFDSGRIVFSQSGVPSGPGTGSGTADLTGHSSVQSDVLRELLFLYRIAGDTRESAFNTGSGQCINATWPPVSSPDRGSLEWTDVDGRGLIRALCEFQVTSTGPDSGCVTARVTVSNLSNAPVTINLFAYCDLDVCASNNIAVIDNPSGTRHLIRSFTCADSATFEGVDADRWEADATSGLRTRLFDGSVDDLSSSGLLLIGDYTAAMQWQSRAIPAGQSATFTARVCHDSNRGGGGCRTAAASVNYGTPQAGTNGIATISTTSLPRLGRTAGFDLGNGPPFTTGLLLIGFGRANLQVGNLTLWTRPADSLQLALDRTGAGSVSVPVPNDGSLCGGQIHFQYLFVDPAVSGTFPIAYTDGLEWTVGI